MHKKNFHPRKLRPGVPVECSVLKFSRTERQGKYVTLVSVNEVTMSKMSETIPTVEDYNIEALRDASTPLERVNTNILNPTEPHTVNQLKESQSLNLYSQYSEIIEKQTSQSTTTESTTPEPTSTQSTITEPTKTV